MILGSQHLRQSPNLVTIWELRLCRGTAYSSGLLIRLGVSLAAPCWGTITMQTIGILTLAAAATADHPTMNLELSQIRSSEHD